MVAKNLFGNALVFAQRQPGRTAAGIRRALHIEKRSDGLVVGAIVLKLVREIEDHVRAEYLQLLAQQVEVVEKRQVLVGMAELVECRELVRPRSSKSSGSPRRLQILLSVLKDRVEKGENAALFSHEVISCAGIYR
jgi:hypothetical protein